MKERDYVIATDLARVRALLAILRDAGWFIANDLIARDEREQVARLLEDWAERLSAALENPGPEESR